jgi:hypothetical protein
MTKTNETTPEPQKPQKSTGIALRAGGSRMRIRASRRIAGGVTTVTTKVGKEPAVRGMTERHATFEAAVAYLEVLAGKAVKQGWTRGTGAFTSKPDAFSEMPAAPKPAKVAK